MAKYRALFSINWQNGLVYRASVLLWRLRQFLSSIMALTIWSVIYTDTNQTLGYSQDQMITYVFLAALLQSIVLSSALTGLANEIYSGDLSNQLLKPLNIYGYLAAEELADKAKNLFFLVIESVLLYFLFAPSLVLPNALMGLLFVGFVVAAVLLNFLVALLFGSIGFWSPDTWGPRFIFFMVLDFTAGKLFPLDILPTSLQTILFATPLPYFSYIPTQLFLGRLDQTAILHHSLIVFGWLLALSILVRSIWHKGLQSYSAAGR